MNLAWKKLNEYYKLMDDSPAYPAAIALVPNCRLEYFDLHWKSKDVKPYIDPTKEKIKHLFDTEYSTKKLSESRQEPTESVADSDSGKATKKDYLKEYIQGSRRQERDEYTRYTTFKPQASGFELPKDQDLFHWWAFNQGTTPRLTQMAYDFLSIPAMSSDCERLFSGVKLTISPQRHRLDARVIEAIELLNAWLRREVITMGSGDDDI